MENVEELFSERGKQLAGLGVLLMILGVGVIPIFSNNPWLALGCIVGGLVLWSPYIFKEFSPE